MILFDGISIKMNKKRFQKLAGIINEQTNVIKTVGNVKIYNEQSKLLLQKYASWLRAINLWFHGAHHVTRGTGFAGDHAILYDKIYTEVNEEIDGAIEKIIGVTNDHTIACPIKIIKGAEMIMESFGSPTDLPLHTLAAAGLEMEKSYVDFVERLFKYLENENLLSLGLNDQLAASANNHETYIYLLQQRTKDH